MHRVGRKRKLNGYVMRPLWIQWALDYLFQGPVQLPTTRSMYKGIY
jgi:hypothetical protein